MCALRGKRQRGEGLITAIWTAWSSQPLSGASDIQHSERYQNQGHQYQTVYAAIQLLGAVNKGIAGMRRIVTNGKAAPELVTRSNPALKPDLVASRIMEFDDRHMTRPATSAILLDAHHLPVGGIPALIFYFLLRKEAQ